LKCLNWEKTWSHFHLERLFYCSGENGLSRENRLDITVTGCGTLTRSCGSNLAKETSGGMQETEGKVSSIRWSWAIGDTENARGRVESQSLSRKQSSGISCLFVCFETESHYVTLAGLKLEIFLSPKYWDYRCALPCLASGLFWVEICIMWLAFQILKCLWNIKGNGQKHLPVLMA
jgi:hypothetical protein